MNADDRRKNLLRARAFEKAKWILTDKKSGQVSEYDYSKMSEIVRDAYISRNSRLDIKSKYVTIRYLHRASCLIHGDGYDEDVSYSQILPNYSIKCYDWHYQCPECDAVQPEIKKKGQKGVSGIYCLSCFEYYEIK